MNPLYLRFDREMRDKYGRLLAYLYRAPDGLFVNLEIVRQGYGQAYTRYPFKHMELFRHYEHRAQEARKGLWDKTTHSKTASRSADSQTDGQVPNRRSSLHQLLLMKLRSISQHRGQSIIALAVGI